MNKLKFFGVTVLAALAAGCAANPVVDGDKLSSRDVSNEFVQGEVTKGVVPGIGTEFVARTFFQTFHERGIMVAKPGQISFLGMTSGERVAMCGVIQVVASEPVGNMIADMLNKTYVTVSDASGKTTYKVPASFFKVEYRRGSAAGDPSAVAASQPRSGEATCVLTFKEWKDEERPVSFKLAWKK